MSPLEHDGAVTRSLRTPRAAGIAGVLFALLLTAALVLVRLAAPAGPGDAGALLADPGRRRLVVVALNLVPFAGIAFLWFIGVVRDRMASARTGSSPPCSWAAGCCSSRCSSRPAR
jgi:hypothetical protein